MKKDKLRPLLTSNRSDWGTPPWLFRRIRDAHGIEFDAAATAENALCGGYFTTADDALAQPWPAVPVFVNPPYGRTVGRWLKKAFEESQRNGTPVVMLLPARTGPKWFRDWALRGQVHFVTRRIRFVGAASCAPFDSMLVIFDPAQPSHVGHGTVAGLPVTIHSVGWFDADALRSLEAANEDTEGVDGRPAPSAKEL